jgi:hypothetical protein
MSSRGSKKPVPDVSSTMASVSVGVIGRITADPELAGYDGDIAVDHAEGA